MFKKAVSVLLVVSVLSWTVGCTSTKYVTDLGQAQGREIEVFTKAGSRYRLTEWAANASGDIQGKGYQLFRDNRTDTVSILLGMFFRLPRERERKEPFSGTIPADSIVLVKIQKGDAVKSAGLVLGTVVIIGSLVFAYGLSNWSFSSGR